MSLAEGLQLLLFGWWLAGCPGRRLADCQAMQLLGCAVSIGHQAPPRERHATTAARHGLPGTADLNAYTRTCTTTSMQYYTTGLSRDVPGTVISPPKWLSRHPCSAAARFSHIFLTAWLLHQPLHRLARNAHLTQRTFLSPIMDYLNFNLWELYLCGFADDEALPALSCYCDIIDLIMFYFKRHHLVYFF